MTSLTEMPVQRGAKGIEFIGLMAALSAIIAFSIDAMLPAFGVMAADLSSDAPEAVALVIPAFALGLGIGTFVVGPLADAFGRRPVILAGLALFALASVVGAYAGSLTMLLASRVLMGLAAAGPRVASVALIRDKVAGAEMARVMSLVMMVFMIVPAVAPWLGSVIIAASGWRTVFWSFAGFATLLLIWFSARQPETLAPATRRPIRLSVILQGARQVLRDRQAVLAMAAQTAFMGALFGTLSSIQPLFVSFGREASFPGWFALMALISAGAGLVNATFVRRMGPRGMAVAVLTMLVVVTAGYLLASWIVTVPFAASFIWLSLVFCTAGLTMGNLSAVGMERLGHLAGLAASVTLALSTIGGAVIAGVIGMAFDGTVVPLAVGVALCAAVALVAARGLRGPAPQD